MAKKSTEKSGGALDPTAFDDAIAALKEKLAAQQKAVDAAAEKVRKERHELRRIEDEIEMAQLRKDAALWRASQSAASGSGTDAEGSAEA